MSRAKIKPLGIKAYGHIPHLPGSRIGKGDHKCEIGQAKICTKKPRSPKDIVIVQEKLDGSCCSVAKKDNQIYVLGRAGYEAHTSPFKMHRFFDEWVAANYKRFYELLNEGERVVGEWLLQAHGTKYNLQHEPFVPFDIMVQYERKTYDEVVRRVSKFDFVMPKLISYGLPISIEDVTKRIKISGHGAIDEVEGAVWRVENDGKVDFLAKYVRHEKIDGCYLSDKPIWNVDIDKWIQHSL